MSEPGVFEIAEFAICRRAEISGADLAAGGVSPGADDHFRAALFHADVAVDGSGEEDVEPAALGMDRDLDIVEAVFNGGGAPVVVVLVVGEPVAVVRDAVIGRV